MMAAKPQAIVMETRSTSNIRIGASVSGHSCPTSRCTASANDFGASRAERRTKAGKRCQNLAKQRCDEEWDGPTVASRGVRSGDSAAVLFPTMTTLCRDQSGHARHRRPSASHAILNCLDGRPAERIEAHDVRTRETLEGHVRVAGVQGGCSERRPYITLIERSRRGRQDRNQQCAWCRARFNQSPE